MLKFLADTILMTFDIEYNQIWPDRMEKVEAWIEENDELLSNGKEENGT